MTQQEKNQRDQYANHLRKLRMEHNLSQQSLADNLGISRSMVVRAENPSDLVRLDDVKALVDLADGYFPAKPPSAAQDNTLSIPEGTPDGTRGRSAEYPRKRAELATLFGELMRRKGITQAAAGDLVGITQSHAHRAAANVGSIGENTLDTILAAVKARLSGLDRQPQTTREVAVATVPQEVAAPIVTRQYRIVKTDARYKLTDVVKADGKTSYTFLETPAGLLIFPQEG